MKEAGPAGCSSGPGDSVTHGLTFSPVTSSGDSTSESFGKGGGVCVCVCV